MASVNGVNIGSNIDTSVIIQALTDIYRSRYITPLENKKYEYQTQQASYNGISLRLATLKSKLIALESGTAFLSKSASSSNENILTAAATTSAANGVYNINVTQLAKQHKVSSAQFSSAGTDIVTAEGAGAKQFRITINGVDKDITVNVAAGESNQTILTNMASAINSSGADAVATVVNETGSSSRLIISSNKTGTTNAMTMQDLSGTLLLNTSVLNGGGGFANELQAAVDAQFSIDGLNFVRSSNEVGDAITGVTLQLKNTGAATLTVKADVAGIKSNIQSFIYAYNDAISYTKAQTAYDEETHTGGVLFHSPPARSLTFNLRIQATDVVASLPNTFNSLAAIGIEVDETGNMSIVDSAKLEGYIDTNLADIQKIFNDGAGSGVAVRMDDYIDIINSSGGEITGTIESLTERISNIEHTIELKEQMLEAYERTLIAKYALLDQLITKNQTILNNLGSYSLIPKF